MEDTFNIQVNGEAYTVTQRGPEEYVISAGATRFAVFPVWDDDNLVWRSNDLVSAQIVDQVGEAIEKHDM